MRLVGLAVIFCSILMLSGLVSAHNSQYNRAQAISVLDFDSSNSNVATTNSGITSGGSSDNVNIAGATLEPSNSQGCT